MNGRWAAWTRRSPTGCCREIGSCWTAAASSSSARKTARSPWKKSPAVRASPTGAAKAGRLYLLRTQAAEALREGPAALAGLLRRDYGADDRAAEELVGYFTRQEAVSEVPDAGTCLIECVANDGGCDYYVHTPLNRAANDALARVATLRLARDYGRSVTSLVADLGCLLAVRGDTDVSPAMFRALFSAQAFAADLARALADSTTLRERFRRVSLTGGVLRRHPERRRPRGEAVGRTAAAAAVRLATDSSRKARPRRRAGARRSCPASSTSPGQSRRWRAPSPSRPGCP